VREWAVTNDPEHAWTLDPPGTLREDADELRAS
jgi:hypothetical protein